MATMQVSEETPTKLVLDRVLPSTSSVWADSRGLQIKTLLVIVGSFTLLAIINHFLFLIIAIGALLFEAFLFYIVLSSEQKVTVIIDLNSGQVTLIEKYISGKEKKKELELEHVSRVLIHEKEAHGPRGRHFRIILDSDSNHPLEINVSTSIMKKLCIKIGEFIKKPVVWRATSGDEIIYEKIIQS